MLHSIPVDSHFSVPAPFSRPGAGVIIEKAAIIGSRRFGPKEKGRGREQEQCRQNGHGFGHGSILAQTIIIIQGFYSLLMLILDSSDTFYIF